MVMKVVLILQEHDLYHFCQEDQLDRFLQLHSDLQRYYPSISYRFIVSIFIFVCLTYLMMIAPVHVPVPELVTPLHPQM